MLVYCMWVNMLTYNSDDTIQLLKARLVGKGFTQCYSIGFHGKLKLGKEWFSYSNYLPMDFALVRCKEHFMRTYKKKCIWIHHLILCRRERDEKGRFIDWESIISLITIIPFLAWHVLIKQLCNMNIRCFMWITQYLLKILKDTLIFSLSIGSHVVTDNNVAR